MESLKAIMPLNFIDCSPQYCCGAIFGLGFCAYYLLEVVKTPQLVCAKGAFRDFLNEHVPILKSKFWPTLWCFESRAQTVLANLLRSRIWSHINYRREILSLSDGGEVALDWTEHNCSPTSPIVIILPGLTGHSQAEYIKCLVNAAKKAGIKCVIFMQRGLGGVKLKTPRLYCASKCEDLGEVIEHVRRLHPNVPIAATGISMGGLILGNYLSQNGKKAVGQLKAGLAISVPWNVFEATKSIEKPYLNLMLNWHLCESLCQNVKNHFNEERERLNMDYETILKSTTVREFDETFTSKHFGYKDADDYYNTATLHDKLHKIQVPLLCLSAGDDPFQPFEALPLKEVSETDHVAMVVTSRGGHIGFLEGLWPAKEEQYMGKVFAQYFTAIFTEGHGHPAFS